MTKLTHHCSECGADCADGNNLCHPSAIVETIVSAEAPVVGACGLEGCTNMHPDHSSTTEAHRDEIKSLRSFALENAEFAFAHLCTAALAGEEWAIERMRDRIAEVSATRTVGEKLYAIRATDTTRPDGAIARSLIDP